MSTTTTFGIYTLVEFSTADGGFSWVPPTGVTSYDVLVVAGGGGGSEQGNGGGAGGAGGLLWLTGQSCTPGVGISGSVGAGGAAGTAGSPSPGSDGTSSVFGSNTAVGGGGGGAGASGTSPNNGKAGGSGGGGAGSTSGTATGGAGTSGQGSAGGSGVASGTVGNRAGGGGGGAGGAGGSATTGNGGSGGVGYDATSILGTGVGHAGWFASGGGGASNRFPLGAGIASAGGGGNGNCAGSPGVAGTAKTGGGGGGGGGSNGSSSQDGGAGGSGVVIVRYVAPQPQGDAAIAATDTIASAGVVGKAIGAAVAATVAITAVGVVGTSSTSSVPATATIAAAGDVLAANEGTSSVDATATVTAAGVVGKTGAATLSGTAALTGAGAVGTSSGAAVSGTATIAAAGTVATAITGTAAVAATVTITAAGSISAPGATDATVTATVTFTAEGIVTSFDVNTDTSNADDGITLDGTAEVVWEPDVVPVPTVFGPQPNQARTVARVIVTPPTYGRDGVGASAFAPATKADAHVPRLRERVLIGDRDWTFLRDTPIRIDNLRFIDPLLYGSGSITIPQVNPQYDENIALDEDGLPYGIGDLAGLERFARVVVQLVDEDDAIIVPDYYKGFVSKINAEGHSLSVELGGQASGRLSALYVTPPVYRRKQGVEHILVDTLRDARVRAHEHDGSSGIGLIRKGGTDGLSIFNETLAVWAGATGTPITFTPNARGAYRKRNKDLESIDFTAYIDSDLVTQSLSQDFMEQWTRVYANGRTAAGELVSFIRTPGMTQETPPDFPGLLQVGDTDDSDGYVTAVQQQLTIHNYLDYADVNPGVFDEELAEAVRELQADAGLLVTAIGAGQDGKVNEPTWNAMWNLEVLGYSLDDARQYPAAQDPRTSKWNRTANGSKLDANEDYDPHLIPVDGVVDVGGPFGERQIKRFAASKLTPRGGVWNGIITLKSGLLRGEHNPGDPFDSSDVADRREVMPNHRIWLPRFMGGIVVTVTGADEGTDETQLLVSTLPLTTMETWTALERAREAESNPGNTWSGSVRKSQVRNDDAPEWDTSSGYIANKRALVEGWNEVKVPAGQTGIVQRIRAELQDPDEFAMLLTQKSVGLGALNARIAPLSDPPALTEPQRHTITLTGSPTGGTFTLDGNSNTTAALSYNAAAGAVQSQVRGLGGAFATATVSGPVGGPWVVRMPSALDLDVGTNSLTGGSSPSISVTTSGPSSEPGRPWYERDSIIDWLEGRGKLEAWGTPKQPCGYGNSLKTDGDGPTAQPITGLFVEEAGFNYETGVEPVLFLYVWVGSDNYLLPGRILRNQRTSGY